MELDYGRLAAMIIAACKARGWLQTDLIENSDLGRSTVQRLWRGDPRKPNQKSQQELERVFTWTHGSVMTILRGGDPTPLSSRPADPPPSRGLIDPDSPDPVIRELSTGPVAGGDPFREELIQLYLDDLAEGERLTRERAARRALRLAAAARGLSPEETEQERKLERLLELQHDIDDEDKPKNPDTPGQDRNTA